MQFSNLRCTLVAIGLAVILAGDGKTWGQEAAQETAQETAPSESDDYYMLKYARTYLQLTEANLAHDKSRNARVRGSVSKARLAERQEDVRVAKKLLAVAEQGGREREFEVFVRLAAAGYRSAYNNWQRARSVQEKTPTPSSAENVKRLRLRAELALINYERGKSLIGDDPAEQTRWKINLLYDEVLRLNARVEQLSRLAQ